MDIQKEREAFNKEFGIDDADTFPAFSGGIESSAALKCNWLGWKKRAEFEYRENPETIEIDGLKTIHKLCKFADEHNMKDCSFTEIVERMFDELAKAQAVPEGFVLIEKKSLRDTYYWDGCEYVVDHPSEYEMELERGEITTLEKWQRTKETKVYCANIYSNEDDFEVVQFETAEEAEKAVAENKAMIEAQEAT